MWQFWYPASDINKAVCGFLLNIFLFVPLGIYCYILLKKPNILKTMFIAFFTSAFVEVFQLLTYLGGFSYEDLSANTVGGLFGGIIYFLMAKYIKSDKLIIDVNIINKVVIVIFLPVILVAVVYSCINYWVYPLRFSIKA